MSSPPALASSTDAVHAGSPFSSNLASRCGELQLEAGRLATWHEVDRREVRSTIAGDENDPDLLALLTFDYE